MFKDIYFSKINIFKQNYHLIRTILKKKDAGSEREKQCFIFYQGNTKFFKIF